MIRIDAAKTFQIIHGFGVTVPPHTKAQSAIYSSDFFNTLITDLGCSIIRTEFLTQEEETPDAHLLNIQLGDFNQLRVIKPDLKVLATISSPPGAMKDGSGQLKPESRQAFGEYLFDMCNYFEQNGCPIYGLGFQNSPTDNFSCTYDKESYYQMFKVLCQIKAQRESATKLLATEDNSSKALTIKEFIDYINSDSDVRNQLEFLGVQGYVDTSWQSIMMVRAFNPTAILKDVYNFIYSRFNSTVASLEKDKWLIENCSELPVWKIENDYDRIVTVRDPSYCNALAIGSLDLAIKINSALTYGNFSSFIYRFASTVPLEEVPNDLTDPTKALCNNGLKTFKYHAVKHFYKYVLPGMTRINVNSDDVVASAFKSDELIVVVLINNENDIIDTTMDFIGANVSKFTSYSSVENEFHHQESGNIVGNKIVLTMLPNSISTYVIK